MAITARQVVERVRAQLIDPDRAHWSDEELLRWLSDAQRTILAVRPGAFAETAVLALEAGTRQVLPADWHAVLDARRNVAQDGVTPGRAVRVVPRRLLDDANPDWHSATKSAVVKNVALDDAEKRVFHVFPPNDGTGRLEVSYAKVPAEVASLDDTLPLEDHYITPLCDFVMFRAHQKDGDHSNPAAAQVYLNAFAQFLGANAVADQATPGGS